jgi:hypothetical protein
MRRLIARFLRDNRGAVSAETVLVMPILVWALMASFVYWDIFRSQNAHMKATYAVTDMITREMTSVNLAYINGMNAVYRHLMQTDELTWIRVTSIQFRASDNTYRVLWSRSTNPTRAPQMTNAMLADLRARIPNMAPDDTAIIVETWREYTPVANMGIGRRVFRELVVSRPRWLSPIPLTS